MATVIYMNYAVAQCVFALLDLCASDKVKNGDEKKLVDNVRELLGLIKKEYNNLLQKKHSNLSHADLATFLSHFLTRFDQEVNNFNYFFEEWQTKIVILTRKANDPAAIAHHHALVDASATKFALLIHGVMKSEIRSGSVSRKCFLDEVNDDVWLPVIAKADQVVAKIHKLQEAAEAIRLQKLVSISNDIKHTLSTAFPTTEASQDNLRDTVLHLLDEVSRVLDYSVSQHKVQAAPVPAGISTAALDLVNNLLKEFQKLVGVFGRSIDKEALFIDLQLDVTKDDCDVNGVLRAYRRLIASQLQLVYMQCHLCNWAMLEFATSNADKEGFTSTMDKIEYCVTTTNGQIDEIQKRVMPCFKKCTHYFHHKHLHIFPNKCQLQYDVAMLMCHDTFCEPRDSETVATNYAELISLCETGIDQSRKDDDTRERFEALLTTTKELRRVFVKKKVASVPSVFADQWWDFEVEYVQRAACEGLLQPISFLGIFKNEDIIASKPLGLVPEPPSFASLPEPVVSSHPEDGQQNNDDDDDGTATTQPMNYSDDDGEEEESDGTVNHGPMRRYKHIRAASAKSTGYYRNMC